MARQGYPGPSDAFILLSDGTATAASGVLLPCREHGTAKGVTCCGE